MPPTRDRAPRPADGATGRGRRRGSAWGLFAETLLVGVVTLPAVVLLVTTPAAVAAGSAHLRRHVSGHGDDITRLLRELLQAVRPLLALGAVWFALVVVGTVNLLAASTGDLAGGRVVAVVTLGVLGAVAVLVLRAGAAWSDADGTGRDPLLDHVDHVADGDHHGDALAAPAPGGRLLVRAAARRAVGDPTGSALLVVSVVAAGVFVWALPALLVVVGGLLSLAVVGVEARRRSRAATAS